RHPQHRVRPERHCGRYNDREAHQAAAERTATHGLTLARRAGDTTADDPGGGGTIPAASVRVNADPRLSGTRALMAGVGFGTGISRLPSDTKNQKTEHN